MKRPILMRILPAALRQWVYFQHYRHRHEAWRSLFTSARLSACPQIAMHNLIPGDEISGSIAFLGFYEWELTKQIARRARTRGLFVDVGANMGYFALLWAGLGQSGRVVAFEASPRNVALLKNNVTRNGFDDRVTVIPKAAGDRNATVTFDTGPGEQTGWGGIASGTPENRIAVPMVRLDEELADCRIEVLKIDTEGADALVLFGCERLLRARSIQNIYFEQNADKARRIGLPQREAQRFLRSVNYECHGLSRDEREWFACPVSA